MPLSTRIGPYRVLRLINQGGQGRVYLGYDTRLHRRVAIKVHRLPAQRSGRERLLREAQLVASIQSSKVVQIHDLHVAQDHVALIMEYVPGCDLEELLKVTRPSVASVLAIATDLAGALTAARQQSIIHGDLKARNVLVTDAGRVKLTDFGIARADTDLTPGALRAGSPSCVSPEQYLGEPMDARSDLFALGCLLYRMLTGVRPFMRDGQLDPNRLLEQQPEAVSRLREDLPAGLAELLNDLLQKSPADRPSGTQQVRFALRDIARALPLSVSSPLLEEARPHFRPDSPEEAPLDIPLDLRRGGRSRLRPFQLDEISSWRGFFSRFGPLGAGVALLATAITLVLSLAWFSGGETRVHIERPQLRLALGATLPRGVSPAWLVEQIKEAANTRFGLIIVTGPIGATGTRTLHASPPRHKVTEKLSSSLRCSRDFCLFTMTRQGSGSRQAVLFPDMPLSEWRGTIHSTAMAILD